MIRGLPVTPFSMLLVSVCLCVGGCAQSQTREAAAEQADADAQFASGATRSPTPQTLYSMAKLLAAQGKYEQSEYVLRQVIREYPTYLPAYAELARQQLETHQPDLAIQSLEQGLAVAPQDVVLLNDLGMVHANLGNYEKALGYFEQAAQISPRDARVQGNRAMALGMLGQYDQAYDIYLSMMPPGQAHYNVGVLAEAREDMTKARQEYALAQRNGTIDR